jgi:NAD(P)-dependent dehydrogenase (short-subunit alcohol dehydrogenase family)
MATFLEVGAARGIGLTIALGFVIARFGYRRIRRRRQSEALVEEADPDVHDESEAPNPFGDPHLRGESPTSLVPDTMTRFATADYP